MLTFPRSSADDRHVYDPCVPWHQQCLRRPSQRIVHGVRKSTIYPLDDVGVGVEGYGYAGVAQKLLDVLRMLAYHEEYCSAGVAQIVERDGGKLRLPK
jgi:hypothetical protein